MKNILIALLIIAVLLLGVFFVMPSLGLNFIKKAYDPNTIQSEIMLEVGTSNVSTGVLCQGVSKALSAIYKGFECQKNRYTASEAKDKIDKIISGYKLKASSDWDIDTAGYSRTYSSKEGNSISSFFILTSNDIVAVGYF